MVASLFIAATPLTIGAGEGVSMQLAKRSCLILAAFELPWNCWSVKSRSVTPPKVWKKSRKSLESPKKVWKKSAKDFLETFSRLLGSRPGRPLSDVFGVSCPETPFMVPAVHCALQLEPKTLHVTDSSSGNSLGQESCMTGSFWISSGRNTARIFFVISRFLTLRATCSSFMKRKPK